jgi:hypothetical protein
VNEYAIEKAKKLIKKEKDPKQLPTQFDYLIDFLWRPLGHTPVGEVLTPIPHLHFGYITPNKTLITLGTAYLWALMGTIRSPFSDHFFFETKVVWWLDAIIAKRGFDGFYLTAGIGYHF